MFFFVFLLCFHPFVPNLCYLESKSVAYLTLKYSGGKGFLNCIADKQSTFSNRSKPPVNQARTIVINEILADPEPPNNLPSVEFIELFNASNKAIDLTNWTISDVSTTGLLPSLTLLPSAYLILCKKGAEVQYERFGLTIAPDIWPSLNNSGDHLILRSNEDVIIDEIVYDKSWYHSTEKQSGGWSIEQINPFLRCSTSSNWNVSSNSSGGTPGFQNSVFNVNSDLRGPQIKEALTIDSVNISLRFNEPILTSTVHKRNFQMDPALEVDTLILKSNQMLLQLVLNEPLIKQKIYSLFVKNLTDCSGNIMSNIDLPVDIVLGIAPDSGDLVLNEVLFNPRSGGVDFIELLNISGNYLELRGISIFNNNQTGNLKAGFRLGPHLAKPGDFMVFTEDSSILKADYPGTPESSVTVVPKMPSLPDKSGHVSVTLNDTVLLDSFNYHEDIHHSLLKDVNGVSLEKISPFTPSLNLSNWHSASSTVGFATPGKQNSVWFATPMTKEKLIIEPRVFQPNHDGILGFAKLKYEFEKPGYSVSIRIYNINGEQVKEIANNDLLGTSGFYTWDGTNEYKLQVPPGYYIVNFSLFDLLGNTKNIRKIVAIAD